MLKYLLTMKFRSGVCTSKARLDGKTALITGSNTGIGKVTVQDFYKRGARVIMACRSMEKANEAADDIKKICDGEKNLGEIVVTPLDLNSFASIRKCASHILDTEKRLDLLINNAGVMCCPQGKTEDGFETQFGVNHLGHFLLTLLLLPRIIQTGNARIVNVSSMAHTRGKMDFDDLNFEKRPFSSLNAYQQSKLCNVLFTKELARRLQEQNISGVNVYSLHPGVIATELGRHLDDTYFRGLRFLWRTFAGWLVKTPQQGAQTSIYCAVDEKCEKETGLYYSDCDVAEPSANAKKMDDAKRLWEVSAKLCGLDSYDPFEKQGQK